MTSKERTVRERIRDLQAPMAISNTTPQQARETLMQLTGLYGYVNDELRYADLAYNRVLLDNLASAEKANRARIRAEATPEYQRLSEARDTQKLVMTMIQSCKVYLRSLDVEMSLAR